MSEVWEGRCTPGRRDKERSWTWHCTPWLTWIFPNPLAALSVDTCGQLHEIAICKWQDGVIPFYFLWFSLWGCGGSSTLLENQKHSLKGVEEASCSCTSIVTAPCHPDAKQQRALLRIWLTPGFPLPFPESPLRCSVDGQSHSYAPSPTVIHRTPREQAVGMLQQSSLPTSF